MIDYLLIKEPLTNPRISGASWRATAESDGPRFSRNMVEATCFNHRLNKCRDLVDDHDPDDYIYDAIKYGVLGDE